MSNNNSCTYQTDTMFCGSYRGHTGEHVLYSKLLAGLPATQPTEAQGEGRYTGPAGALLKVNWEAIATEAKARLQDYESWMKRAENERDCAKAELVGERERLAALHLDILDYGQRIAVLTAELAALKASHADEIATAMTHTRSCPQLTPSSDDDCTCGLRWRIELQTEREMHNAWRKRAEESEAELAALKASHADEIAHVKVETAQVTASQYDAAMDSMRENIRTLKASQQAEIEAARESWRCFFCGEVFTDRREAWFHFGDEHCTSDAPACVDPLRDDEKARMKAVREVNEYADKMRLEADENQDAAEQVETLWSELRSYFGEDCNSTWLAGDRYKSALNCIRDLEQAEAAHLAELAKVIRQCAAVAEGSWSDCASMGTCHWAAMAILALLTPEMLEAERILNE